MATETIRRRYGIHSMTIEFLIILLLSAKFENVHSDSINTRLTSCGVDRGCWLAPAKCADSDGPTCMAVLSWNVAPDRITFALVTWISDLFDSPTLTTSVYGAVGFSLDARMGDDTVFVCALNGSGQGQAYISWNDAYSSTRQYEATAQMIQNVEVGLADHRMNCQLDWVFAGRTKLNPADQSRIFDLSNGNIGYHLLFARGSADPFTLNIKPHAMYDGLKFPFASSSNVSFCSATECSASTGKVWIPESHQAVIPMDFRQQIAISHAILMLLTTFVLFPTGIMSARFGKDHLRRCCGIFVWFHVHHICNIGGFLCATVAFFLIYYQASFRAFRCNIQCTDTSYFRRVHAVLGTTLYSMICCQVIAGLCRPGVAATSRKRFNWFHIFAGYGIWAGLCVNTFLGVGMPKLQMLTYYSRYPYDAVAVALCLNVICFIVCEWIVHKLRYSARDPDSVQKLYDAGISVSGDYLTDNEKMAPKLPILLIAFNAICGICITAILGIFSVRSAEEVGFPI